MSKLLQAWYVFLALALVTLVATAFIGQAPTVLSATVALPHNMPYRAGVNVRTAFDSMRDRRNLRSDNEALRNELDRERQRIRDLELEAARMREILAIRDAQSPGVITTAPVIGGSSGTMVDRLQLGSGRSAPLEVGMPVTVPAGLVGIVTDVVAGRGVVRTLLDPESRVGVTVRGKGGQGVGIGDVASGMRVVRFVEGDPVEVGDVVETSSYGGLFPRGVRVGTVVAIDPRDPNELRRSFLVEPAADLSTLLEVALITPP